MRGSSREGHLEGVRGSSREGHLEGVRGSSRGGHLEVDFNFDVEEFRIKTVTRTSINKEV